MNTKYIEGESGICPVCESDELTYEPVQDCDTGICYPWKCNACGATGFECYDIEFTNHEVVSEDSGALAKYMDYVLEDDDTPTGGTSFSGETVRDFIMTADRDIRDLDMLNAALKECGIKPILP